jgi:hypothetical protein
MDKIQQMRYYPRTTTSGQLAILQKLDLINEEYQMSGEYAPFGIILSLDDPTLANICQGMKDHLRSKEDPR